MEDLKPGKPNLSLLERNKDMGLALWNYLDEKGVETNMGELAVNAASLVSFWLDCPNEKLMKEVLFPELVRMTAGEGYRVRITKEAVFIRPRKHIRYEVVYGYRYEMEKSGFVNPYTPRCP